MQHRPSRRVSVPALIVFCLLALALVVLVAVRAVSVNNAESAETLAFAREYLGIGENDDLAAAVLRAGMRSKAELFVFQMQDVLGLGAEARINTPGTVGGNWCWRMLPGALTDELADHIAAMTAMYSR